jgi:Uma2 family endonuclease
VGRLEHVDGRLLYMPPCGDLQQDTTTDVVITLGTWVRGHQDYVLGTNEAGMRLGGSTRAADAAVWKRADLGAYTGGLRRIAPILAVEVAGPEAGDTEAALREKAAWCLGVGVEVVWIVLAERAEILVIRSGGESRLSRGERVPAHPSLPDLEPLVDELFVQIDARR